MLLWLKNSVHCVRQHVSRPDKVLKKWCQATLFSLLAFLIIFSQATLHIAKYHNEHILLTCKHNISLRVSKNSFRFRFRKCFTLLIPVLEYNGMIFL